MISLIFQYVALGEACATNDDCDFDEKRHICQTIDANDVATYHTCVVHCQNDFECSSQDYCSCGATNDNSDNDTLRAACLSEDIPITYCRVKLGIKGKCYRSDDLISLTLCPGKICSNPNITSTDGTICTNNQNWRQIKGCVCDASSNKFRNCYSCSSTGQCASCPHGFELEKSTGKCIAICRNGINLIDCKCGSLKTSCLAGQRCNSEFSTICAAAGCQSCTNYDICTACGNGYYPSGQKCLKICSVEQQTNCLCGQNQIICPNNNPICDYISGICSADCDISIQDNCVACDTIATTCSSCKEGYKCLNGSTLSQTSCTTQCQKICSADQLGDCLCENDAQCGGAGHFCDLNAHQCFDCISNCSTCSSKSTCDQCASNYGFIDSKKKDKCIQKCQSTIIDQCICGESGTCQDNQYCSFSQCYTKQNCNQKAFPEELCQQCWQNSALCQHCLKETGCILFGKFVNINCNKCDYRCTSQNNQGCICTDQSDCGEGFVCEQYKCTSCLANCQQCSSSKQCDYCSAGYGCENNAQSCTECKLMCGLLGTNCLCGDHKVLCSGTQKCQADQCVEECNTEDVENCYCGNGLEDKDGKCVKSPYNSALYDFTQQCQQQFVNCQLCNLTDCILCEKGYMLSASGICVTPDKLIVSNIGNQLFDSSKQQYISCSEKYSNCLLCNETECLICMNNYQLNNGSCNMLKDEISNIFFDENVNQYVTCDSVYSNCLLCNANACMLCNTDYVLQYGRCYTKGGDTKQQANGCYSFNYDSNNCILCKSGYLLNGGSCSKTQGKNSERVAMIIGYVIAAILLVFIIIFYALYCKKYNQMMDIAKGTYSQRSSINRSNEDTQIVENNKIEV